jgi:hypothetical protein
MAEQTTGRREIQRPIDDVAVDQGDLVSDIPVDDEMDELANDQPLDDGPLEDDDEVVYGDDVPQALTESYGTGVHDLPGYVEGGRSMQDRFSEFHEATPELTGGDIDANFEQANAVGDEAVGGTAPTPDMDIVDDLGKAVGLEMDDRSFLRTNDILEERDDRRWEMDPSSAEDYGDRRSEEH